MLPTLHVRTARRVYVAVIQHKGHLHKDHVVWSLGRVLIAVALTKTLQTYNGHVVERSIRWCNATALPRSLSIFVNFKNNELNDLSARGSMRREIQYED